VRPALITTALAVLVASLVPSGPAAAAPATAPRPAVTLADLGRAPLILAGGSPAAVVAFPIPAYGITGGELALEIQPSPALLGHSQVRVFVEDALAAVTSVTALRRAPAWTMRVGAARGPWLHVRLEAALSIDRPSPCDQQAGASWLSLGGGSAFRYDAAPGVPSIGDFLRFPGGRLVLDADWATPAGRVDAIAVYAALRRAIGSTPTDLVVGGDAPSDADASKPSRHVVVAASGSPMRRDGTSLLMAADQASLDLVATAGSRSALLAGALSDPSIVQSASPRCGPNRLCLSDLGLREQAVSGTGTLPTSFGFTIADIGGWPTSLAFDLDAAFDAVPTTTLERAVVRVRLNGALVDTVDIRGRSSLQRQVPLPTSLLDVSNRVDVEFVYAPVTGNCEGSPYAFTGELRRTSGLAWSGSAGSRGLLGEIVAMPGSAVALEVSGATAALARTAARILGAVSVYRAQPFVVRPSVPGADAGALRFVVGRALPPSLPARLSLGTTFEMRSASTGRTLLRVTPDRPLVSLEYLADRDLLVLQSSPGAGDALEGTAFAEQFTGGRWLGAAGNGLVSNGDETIALDLASPAIVVTSNAQGMPWWIALRPGIFGLGAVAVLLGLLLVYRRVGRRPPIPARPMGR
jgi:hypothetical protein